MKTYDDLKTKSLNKLRIGNEYLRHMGFYFDDFEKIINKYFTIEEKRFSPFRNFSHNFNAQVFYILKKR